MNPNTDKPINLYELAHATGVIIDDPLKPLVEHLDELSRPRRRMRTRAVSCLPSCLVAPEESLDELVGDYLKPRAR